ncbi:hypothetical protein, partial [Microcoleus sp. T3_D1]|uniref:hypothetical protein n=1 Tax=Microcoleus sp. T3_D1 TaxID=3055427 RepID=UPI002FD6CD4A
LLVGWGRVYLDCLLVLNIIRKTRPYNRPPGRVSPTIYMRSQQYHKPALPNDKSESIFFAFDRTSG